MQRRAFHGIVLLSLLLNVTAIWWGLPSRFGWAVDELQPSVILEGIQVRFSGDWHQPAYPPLHYYLLALAYLPVLALDLVDPRSVSGQTLFFYLGRFLTIAMGVGILILVNRLGREIFDARSGLLASLIVALTVPFVYYGKTTNLDVPAAFWVVLSFYFFVRLVGTNETRYYFLLALSAVAAMATKDQAFAFFVLPLFVYAVLHRKVLDRRVLYSLAAGIVAFFLVHNVVLNFQGFIHHFEEILWARGHYSAYESGLAEQLALLRQTLHHLSFALGWPVFLASLAGVVLVLRDRRKYEASLWILFGCLSFYLFFIAPVRSTWLRYSIPLAILLSLFGGAFVSKWIDTRGGRLIACVALLYSLARAASVDVLLLQDSRYDAERWLAANVTAGELVGYMGPEYYLPRLERFQSKRLRPTESVLDRERPDYLVVNPEYAMRFVPGSREQSLFSRLKAGRAGYALVLRTDTPRRWVLLDFSGLLANMSKVSPVIEIYQRAG